MKNWRLGLDLGTNSIGWCVIGLDRERNPETLIDMGVRIFSDGRDPKTKEPLAVARRIARGVRKNIRRRKQRRKNLFKVLQDNDLYPTDKDQAFDIKKLDPYYLRVEALDRELSPFELGRTLFNLGVRRGFKSNRKDNSEEKVEADVVEKKVDPSKMSQGERCLSLFNLLHEGKYRTLGEFLLEQKKNGIGSRFVPGRWAYYPLRAMYEAEFDAIKEKQEPFYPSVKWDDIKTCIFYQRPLKKMERGKCQFYTHMERTFKAMPSSHRFRILQEVYNLAMYDERAKPVSLTEQEQDSIIQLLDTKDKLTFDQIRKHIKKPYRFNLESETRAELKGNETSRKLRSEKAFGPLWDTLSIEKQDSIVEAMVTADEDNEVMEVLKDYPLTEDQKKNILRMTFSSGTTSICKQLTESLVNIMSQQRLRYDLALESIGIKHSEEMITKFDLLPYYGIVLSGAVIGGDYDKYPEDQPEKKYGKIANPTVHVALNQTRVVLNALIKKYGKPEQVVIELSRDLKASKDQKAEIIRKQAENRKENDRLNIKVSSLMPNIQYPGRFERLKYKLWEELGSEGMPRRCLYCGGIISGSELYSPNIEVEHILPYSRTLLDNENNLTIAHKKCNAFKKERSPYEAFGSNPSGYNWNEIVERVECLRNKTKRSRFNVDAIEAFDKDSSFITRQLNDNKYLSKVSRLYVSSVCDNVWVVTGGMTKLLRDKWEIDQILKRKIGEAEKIHFNLKDEDVGEYKKNRYDHRHHALDALVIGLVDRNMVQEISTLCAHSYKNRLEAPPRPFLTLEIIEKIKNIVISFKPDHGVQGKLSKETLLGKIKIETKISIEKLEDSDIENIKILKVREDIKAAIEEKGSLRVAIRGLKDTYPQVIIFRDQFVTRIPITTLKTEANIVDIVDLKIRKQLRDFIDHHQEWKFDRTLIAFSEATGIKKVRCTTRIQKPIKIEPDPKNPLAITRYLNPEDYFAAIVWEIPPAKDGAKKKYEAQFIRRTEMGKNNKPIEEKPHPAARKVCQLHKNDCIEFSEDGIWKKARIAGYAATANKLDIRPIYATNDTRDWLIATSEFMLEKWKMITGQYYISINVLFGALSARKFTTNPIGEVSRKKVMNS
jgi:CRISPR-associated endonuclease Csn1